MKSSKSDKMVISQPHGFRNSPPAYRKSYSPSPEIKREKWLVYPEKIAQPIVYQTGNSLRFLPKEWRLGGSSFSSGVVLEESSAGEIKWLAKCHSPRFTDNSGRELIREISEVPVLSEKMSNDIYAYYGAKVASTKLALLPMMNTGLKEDSPPSRSVIHFLSRIYEDANPYSKLAQFHCDMPNFKGCLPLPDGQLLPERGLGRILAVADFINDTDVVGISGGNILYKIETDSNTGEKYAQTIKIDPGYAFNLEKNKESFPFCLSRHIRVANPQYLGQSNVIKFDNLPKNTRDEYLMTLHLIMGTPDPILKSFFNRSGGERFILFSEREQSSYIEQLKERRWMLSKSYEDELKNTSRAFNENKGEHKPIQHEVFRHLQSLGIYISPQVKHIESNALSDWKDFSTVYLDGNTSVLLLQGEIGSGKTLSLLWLKSHLLEGVRRDPKSGWYPLYIELKKYNAQNVVECIKKTLLERNESIYEWRKRKVALLLDGYDEIEGDNVGNLYERLNLSDWSNLKVIISCRRDFLPRDYRKYFVPTTTKHFQEIMLCPFNQQQVESYLERCLSNDLKKSALEQYKKHLAFIPTEWVQNPLMLRITYDVISQPGFQTPIKRSQLIKNWLEKWIINQENRLRGNQSLRLLPDLFKSFIDFCCQLGLRSIETRSINHISCNEDLPWAQFLADSSPEAQQIQQTCAVIRNTDGTYSFRHQLFEAYFTALAIDRRTVQDSDSDQGFPFRPSPLVMEFLREMMIDSSITQDSRRLKFEIHLLFPIKVMVHHPTKPLLAIAQKDRVILWDWKMNQIHPFLYRHETEISCLAFNLDGSTLISVGRDKKFCLWDMTKDTFPLKALIKHLSTINYVNFSNKGDMIVSITLKPVPSFCFLDSVKGNIRHYGNLNIPTGEICSCLLTKKDELIFAVRDTKKIYIFLYNPVTGNIQESSLLDYDGEPSCFSFDPNGNFLIYRHKNGKLIALKINNRGPSLEQFDYESGITSLVFSSFFDSLSAQGKVLLNIKNDIISLAFSHNAPVLFLGSETGRVVCFEVPHFMQISSLSKL